MKNDKLVRLICSMSKSEKRNFKLLATKTGGKDKIYIQLFDFIEHYEFVDEDDDRRGKAFLFAKIPTLKPRQLSNQKNILYKLILRSLRDTNKDIYLEIQAREQFDFAKVLYAKGEYRESLEFLQKAKRMARSLEKSSLIYLALDFEKQIEAQHVTGSMSARAVELAKQSEELVEDLQLTNQLSNLSLLLYGRYLKNGFARSISDFDRLEEFFYSHLPEFESYNLNFRQRLYLYQSYVWYHYMSQNFAKNYRYALKWIDLFNEQPSMIEVDTASYLKGLHNVLSSLYLAGKRIHFQEFYDKLQDVRTNKKIHFNVNETSLLNLFGFVHGINRIILFVDYKNGLELVDELIVVLEVGNHGWDRSRLLVFYYKIACIYFGNQMYEEAIIWLNKIINENFGSLKQDVQCFARILSLITHYEMGHELLVSYQIISVYRFLLKMRQLGKVQREIFIFLRKTAKINRSELNPEFGLLKDKLLVIAEDVYERRAFLYLDIISWLDSKLDQISMVEAIENNMLNNGS
ncbi:hypothetical protein N9B82_05095 [Saprospiraceae bacterium]|nr:hypothetical protein [Saprospiraceae bacterium]